MKTDSSAIFLAPIADMSPYDRAASHRENDLTFKATPFLLSVVLLLAGSVATVHGQSALDGFDPNANDTIRVVVVQPDGKILIGGDFTTLAPNGGGAVTRNRIARLNPDGTIDTAFNPNASAAVHAIALQLDGGVLVGGQFTNIGGQARNRIARLNGSTGLADSFNPNAGNTVLSIAVQEDGQILAGGGFFGANSIGGQTRNFIARLDATTGLADAFDPNANDFVRAITVQADGKILVGGDFRPLLGNSIGGAMRTRIARIDPATGLADSFDPNANNQVLSIAVQADGQILTGGAFTNIGGQTRNRIARLDATTGAADSFNPNANSQVNAIVAQADGKILVGGVFNGANSIGGQARNRIARLDPITGLADSFNSNANNIVLSLAIQVDGKILAGGIFNGAGSIAGQTRNRIARLEADGRLDQTLNLNIVGNQVLATVVQPDGKILIGGSFTTVLGVTRNGIARLNTDGTLDTAFNPNSGLADVYAIALQADGQILVGGIFMSIGGAMRRSIARLDATTGLADSFNPNENETVTRIVNAIVVEPDGNILVGGDFTSIGGEPRNYIARLDPTTGSADAFDPNANEEVFAIAVQSDGKILVGGKFREALGVNTIGGATRNFIARLDPATGLADSFDPNANSVVYSIALQADGNILVGGAFNGGLSMPTIGGETRNNIARLDPTTGLADSFNPNATYQVYTIAVQGDGKILVGGIFESIGGEMRNNIARLDPSTGLADSFNPNANFIIFSLALQGDGKILAGGLFGGTIGGQMRNFFARLTNDTSALQELAVTQTTITWTRDGSSPLLARVTFEESKDNVDYTLLGDGTADGNNWTLAGLNVLAGQNVYIRARGHYSSGRFDGSGSTTESVRNVFLGAGPTPTPINISGTVSYCSNPSAGPVPGVTLTLTGTSGSSTLSDGSGGYTFTGLVSGGSYTVAPSKTARTPGSAGINTIDMVAIQRHFLSLGIPLSGCRLSGADVNIDASVNTIDVIAVQRFFLGLTTGVAQVGKYKFTPPDRTYPAVGSDQTAQNYDTLTLGDVASSFVHRPDGPSQ